LPKHVSETYEATWARAKGSILGEASSRALKTFEEADKVKTEAALARRTVEAKIKQEQATANRIEAEARKLLAEAQKAEAEAKKAEAEALKTRVDALVTFTDRLKEMGVACWFDDHGNLHWHAVPKDADWEKLNSRILTAELL